MILTKLKPNNNNHKICNKLEPTIHLFQFHKGLKEKNQHVFGRHTFDL
jgi:hypothetical protein